MPSTLTIPEDLLSAEAEAALFARLSETLLDIAAIRLMLNRLTCS